MQHLEHDNPNEDQMQGRTPRRFSRPNDVEFEHGVELYTYFLELIKCKTARTSKSGSDRSFNVVLIMLLWSAKRTRLEMERKVL